MSDYYLPFEIQSEIMKKLPVKSLVQFRSVSKQWRSFIDSPEFIKTYHINHTNPKHHLLLEYNYVPTYTSIVDDNTFPQQKFSPTVPDPLNSITYTKVLGSIDGLICFDGWYKDNKMVVLWNPSVRKYVGIPIPNVLNLPYGCTRIAFGVCRDTNDPKLVKINVIKAPNISWEVQVFTLSSRVWKTVYTGASFKSCNTIWDHVFIDGIIYWGSRGPRGSFITSFDLKSEKFGEVSIPEGFVGTYGILVVKVNESLGLLEYYEKGGMSLCGLLVKKDGVNKPFTKMYTIKVEGKSVLNSVLGFRNNGEVLLELYDDDDSEGSEIEVYEPLSGRSNSVGISGELYTFNACSYMETLLLLDQSNAIIH